MKSENLKQMIFCSMQPMTWYRPVDINNKLDFSKTAIQASLRELAKGGGN